MKQPERVISATKFPTLKLPSINDDAEELSSELSSLGAKTTQGGIQLFFQSIIRSLTTFIFFGIAARLLPLSDMGVYSGLSLIVTTIFTIFSLGMMTTASRYVSTSMTRTRADVRGTINTFIRYGVVAGAIAGIVCYLLADLLSLYFFGSYDAVQLIRLIAIDIFALIVVSISTGTLLGLMRYTQVTLVTILFYIIRSVAGILLILQGHGVQGIVMGWILGDVIGAILLISLANQFKSPTVISLGFRKIIPYAIPIYLSELLFTASGFVDKFAILTILGTDSLALYHVPIMVFSAITLLSKSLSSALFPAICRVDSHGGPLATKAAARIASRYVFMVYIPIAFAFAAFAVPIVEIIGGPSYALGAPVLMLISIASAILSGTIIMEIVIKSSERVFPYFATYLLAVVIETIGCFLLVPIAGIIGAAISRVLLTGIVFICLGFIHKKRGTISLDVRAMLKLVFASGLALVPVYLINQLLGSVIGLIISALVYCAILLISLRLLRLVEPTDYEYLEQAFPPIVSRVAKLILG